MRLYGPLLFTPHSRYLTRHMSRQHYGSDGRLRAEVSGPVVVDRESFLDALFASAGGKAEALGSIGYNAAFPTPPQNDNSKTGG